MRNQPRPGAIGLKLSTKVVIALYAVFAVYGCIDYTIQRQVIRPSFQSLEDESARTDMERVIRALDRELTQLMTFSADWGNWIDTYGFMEDRNEDFIGSVHGRDSLVRARLALDRDGRFLALDTKVFANMGAYVSTVAPVVPTLAMASAMGGVYDIQMTELAQQVLLLTKYKPAKCNGNPCMMVFPFRLKLKGG